ncbi:MAG: redox-regulated ATPase YchF [Candidatus Wildermuthbacteria bacterium]|nr:redox-regulated ATPase YchF [Candidatus Wildermuthbacteria bacterium]
MKLSVGIVGLPNVGKSTLFQALTKKEVNIANYPFATIDPNVGVVEVPDPRLQKLAELSKSAKIIPAIVEFVDIAGLVKGANKGEGLGNKFLASIREVAAIVQVVRGFPNQDIIHVEKTVDPLRDVDTINTELQLKDLETTEKGSEIPETQLLAKKPVIYLLNADPKEVSQELLQRMKSLGPVVVANLKDELEMQQLSEEERKEFGFVSYLPELITKAYEILNLITFLTTGADETRAWTIKRGSTAPQAGGAIHSDFEKNFIKAEVIQWEKLLEAGSWSQAAAKGWIRQEGKEYIVQDGDVIEIKHG